MLSKIKSVFPFLLVLTVSSALFVTKLGANSLADWDEAWYADASRFMFRHDHFLTPIWNSQYFFDKPPLQYWITQPFLHILGESEIAYRLPSALAAVGITLIAYLWGKKRSGVFAGLAAAAILLSFPHFLDRGRSGNFDALFTFFATLSLFLFTENKPFLAGIPLGLAMLTKGIFPGLFPIVTLGFMSLCQIIRNRSASLFRQTLVLAAVAAAVYLPWHLMEYTRFDRLIEQSYFATFDQGEFGGWGWMSVAWRFDLRYLVFLWTFLRWWFPILLLSLMCQFGKFAKFLTTKQRFSSLQASLLPFFSFAVIFLALSAAKSKNDWYIMPAYPFIALMITDFISQIFRTGPDFSFSKNQLARPNPPTGRSSGRVRIILKRPEVRLGGPKLRGRLLPFIFIFSISISNLYLYRRQAFPPDKWKPEKELGLMVNKLTAEDDLIVTAEYEFPALRFYSERQIRTAARQPDYEGKYWWIWDNTDIATAFRHGKNIVTVHRPGTEWPIDVWGYHREKLGEINGRIISRLVPN